MVGTKAIRLKKQQPIFRSECLQVGRSLHSRNAAFEVEGGQAASNDHMALANEIPQ